MLEYKLDYDEILISRSNTGTSCTQSCKSGLASRQIQTSGIVLGWNEATTVLCDLFDGITRSCFHGRTEYRS